MKLSTSFQNYEPIVSDLSIFCFCSLGWLNFKSKEKEFSVFYRTTLQICSMAIAIQLITQETFKWTKVFLWVFLISHQIAVQISERKLRYVRKVCWSKRLRSSGLTVYHPLSVISLRAVCCSLQLSSSFACFISTAFSHKSTNSAFLLPLPPCLNWMPRSFSNV